MVAGNATTIGADIDTKRGIIKSTINYKLLVCGSMLIGLMLVGYSVHAADGLETIKKAAEQAKPTSSSYNILSPLRCKH